MLIPHAVIYPKLDCWLDFEQAQASRPGNSLGAIMGVQLPEDMVNMAFHSPDRDHKLRCNLLVGSPLGDEAQHFQLAFAEPFSVRCLSGADRADSHPTERASGIPMAANIRSMYSLQMPRWAASTSS